MQLALVPVSDSRFDATEPFRQSGQGRRKSLVPGCLEQIRDAPPSPSPASMPRAMHEDEVHRADRTD